MPTRERKKSDANTTFKSCYSDGSLCVKIMMIQEILAGEEILVEYISKVSVILIFSSTYK